MASVLRNMWSRNLEPLFPTDIRALLGEVREDFQGTQQQDAHDMLTMLLQHLEYDLNRVRKPPTTQVSFNVRARVCVCVSLCSVLCH